MLPLRRARTAFKHRTGGSRGARDAAFRGRIKGRACIIFEWHVGARNFIGVPAGSPPCVCLDTNASLATLVLAVNRVLATIARGRVGIVDRIADVPTGAARDEVLSFGQGGGHAPRRRTLRQPLIGIGAPIVATAAPCLDAFALSACSVALASVGTRLRAALPVARGRLGLDLSE